MRMILLSALIAVGVGLIAMPSMAAPASGSAVGQATAAISLRSGAACVVRRSCNAKCCLIRRVCR